MRGQGHLEVVTQARAGVTGVQEAPLSGGFAARRTQAPRRNESSAHAKWPLSMEGVCGQENRSLSQGNGEADLGGPAREDPREGVKDGPPKTGARDATRTSEVGCTGLAWDNIPVASESLESGVNVQLAEAEPGRCERSLPRPRGRSQNLPLPHDAQASWTHREPASTGARSREVWEADIDRTHRRCLSGGTSQGVASREVPSPKETDTSFTETS